LFDHLDQQGAQFIQFSFRWMNCLLMREFPLAVVVRLWDTYLAESDQFPVLHTYVCTAMLLKFSHEIQVRDFQGLMIFLQNLPTQGWQPDEIEPILSQAFMWMTLYNDAPSHLK
jgi:TBC1 domain family member 2